MEKKKKTKPMSESDEKKTLERLINKLSDLWNRLKLVQQE